MKMKNILLWIGALLAFNVGFADDKSKNILIFFVDDLAQRDIAIYGNDFHETPNVDRLAREGVMFSNAYSSSSLPDRDAIYLHKRYDNHSPENTPQK